MTNFSFAKNSLLAVVSLATLGTACQRQDDSQSRVKFVKTTPTKAILEKRDLKDKFLFGLNVIETKGFFSTALNLNFRPVESQLILSKNATGKPQLIVASEGRSGLAMLLAFDVNETSNGQIEVDFSSAGNELNLWNQYGGAVSDADAGRDAGSWQTAAQPQVVKVDQDADTVIADIVHTVTFKTAKAPASGEQSRTGQVKLRVFLKRQAKIPTVFSRSVGESLAQNIGYFPASRGTSSEENMPIAHYKIDVSSRKPAQQIVYLKGFPSDYADVAKRAIESWNISFGFAAFRAEVAGDAIDLGDPRYNVVKWIDGLDEEVPWAGYAPTMANPVTGEVLATQILINGSTTLKNFDGIYKYTTEAAPQFNKLSGKIGNVPLVEGAGENPVVSFFADTNTKSADEYIKGYYFSVIMHEFGHSLGLRHNFAGSTVIDSNGISSSVMDYEPGFVTNARKVPGSYDHAAIRWGYFGEKPTQKLAFCTDEDMAKRFDCNQGDVGNPVSYVVAGLIEGTTVLENLIVPLPDMVKKPMKGIMKTALKLLDMQAQIPDSERLQAVADINRALDRVKNAQPADGLSASERAIAEANLTKLAASYADATTPAAKAPVAFNLGL
ncbi:hypothetical protein EBU99_10315 [bacterium]|nr:hypothetical protein [bacterium]